MYIKFIPISAYGRNKKYKKQNYTSPPVNYIDLPLKQQHNVHSSLYLYQLIVETRYTRNKTIPPPPVNYIDLPLKQQQNVHSSLYPYQLMIETRNTRNKSILPHL